MNTAEWMNFPDTQQLKPHCQKCGRRSRDHKKYINNRRFKSEQGHYHNGHRRQCRLFPQELLSYPIITPTNGNYSQNQPCSNDNNILIDQLIEVKQIDPTRCHIPTHSYDNDYKKDANQTHRNPMNIDRLHQVQQMVYLRENINNLNYREYHFSSEYIILKRLEEKNNFINQNYYKVDHYFRPLKLQYQTKIMLFQNTTITSFNYSKQDLTQVESIVKTPWSISENISNDTNTYSSLANEQSLSTLLNMNDTTDSLAFITSYNKQQYSQNAASSVQNNWNHLQSTFCNKDPYPPQTVNIPFLKADQQLSTNTNFSNPIYNKSLSNISHETNTCFPNNNYLSLSNFHTKSESQKSLSFTTTNTNSEENSQSRKYTQIINKIKEILNIIHNKLNEKKLNMLTSSTQISNKIDQSPSTIMTTDSLISNTSIQTTYSVSSTLPVINIENQTKSHIKLLNLAKNLNTNHQASDDDELQTSFHYTRSKRFKPHQSIKQYMSPSFMFTLQILLIACFLNRFLINFYFNNALYDPYTSMNVDNIPSIAPISYTKDEIIKNFLSSFF
ncbi:unnamed protein product [Adineta steineri]|uniref:Uncharacterized protein n=1 Tax=Adineta steineri TaxID=433720 RepID=A0A818N1T8_9BILA|nr:unnamed protein product [Adineta steineri]